MKLCLNQACPFAVRYHHPAEYRDEIERCADCQGALEPAPSPSEPVAPRPPVIRRFHPQQAAGRALMFAGACWLVGGLFITAITSVAPFAGRWVIAVGPVFYGLFLLMKGWLKSTGDYEE